MMPAVLVHRAARPRERWEASRTVRQAETPLHRSILAYLRTVLPHGAAATLHHSPNEECDPVARRKAAELGTRPGWPDLEWVGRRDDGTSYTAMLEVKPPHGVVRTAQTECHDSLRDAGALVAVVRSIDDVRAFLAGCDLPTREVA